MKLHRSLLLSFFRAKVADLPLLCAVFVLSVGASAAMGATISGTVTNQTTKKPSVGDSVELMRLGMQVAGKTTTDAHGHFTLEATDGAPMHLLRVIHDKATYFRPAPAGTSNVNIDVYDAAEKVAGVSTEADVARIEASPNGLSVIENFFVKNASSPPRTQFGPRAYEIYLPKEAQVVASAAQGPGSMPVQTPPTPLGTAGDYAFVYPLRPGETRFQVSYQLPYSGSFQFHPRVSAPVDNLAIILPKSVQFAGTPVGMFQPIDEDVKVQTYLARNVTPQSKLAFTITGTGLLPQESTAADNGNGAPAAGTDQGAMGPEAAQSAAANNTRPGIGLGVPIDTPDPLHKYKWWILSLAAVLLAVGAAFLMKQNQPVAATAGGPAVPLANVSSATKPTEGYKPPLAATAARAISADSHRSKLMEALKEELFALETERLEGRIAPDEYEKQKGALEIVLVRALQSGKAKVPAEAL
ncbi:MAG TPA: carboxypeptidase-like regulatory domain-containing protein [Acidobacteriaceae bacterium]|nr:carboxypeptidase-like regulatory domain-containing protein [Acidobacteriaceae bacterium]